MLKRIWNIDWWKYILEKPDWYSRGYCSGFQRIMCRIKGHPCGMWFYTPNKLEPNTRCKDCGDNIG